MTIGIFKEWLVKYFFVHRIVFKARISAAFPIKIESFFPKIGQIIPKLIGVIVRKNPDLVTVSGNVFLYYVITYPVITVFCNNCSRIYFEHSITQALVSG
jgi:hypothetical protein